MAPPRKPDDELIGQKFGRMTVLAFDCREKRKRWWLCRCDCGAIKRACHSDLLNGATKSCGCLHGSQLAAAHAAKTIHGHSGKRHTPTYATWHSMKQRCLNSNSSHYHLYGGKGVSICERWLTFENFLADMGRRPAGRSIDRIDSAGNYEPSNCRWATPIEQGNNTKRNVFVEYQGERFTVAQLARQKSVKPSVLGGRLDMGWDIERALTEPVQPRAHRAERDVNEHGTTTD